MRREETKITTKYQTTIPRNVRKYLRIKPGKEVEWHIVKGMVVVDTPRRVKNPVKILTSQIKLNLNAVKLVKEAREDFG
jgi:bifunctional DNA-binding transcriptional regulator/antitoxin component of YhaV-PrlF toxin-antitoxin module